MNTPHETSQIDKMQEEVQKYFKNVLQLPCPDFRFNLPIERSAYDSAMSEEVKEKWEIEFDKLLSIYLGFFVVCVKSGIVDKSINEQQDKKLIDFIRTQRSLAQQEILDRAIKLFEPTPEYLKCMKVMSENGTMCAMCGFCPMKAKELLSTLKDTNI